METVDYEKKYKEVLEWARKVIQGKVGFVLDEVLEKFPELKESEDERIRKKLLEYFKSFTSETFFNGVPTSDAIAWLEKQGETSPILSNSLNIGKDAWSEEEQNRFAKCVLTSCAMSFIDFLDAHKYEGKMCVSNGECEDIENAFHNAMWDRLHRYYCKYIEKQGEQKLNPVLNIEIPFGANGSELQEASYHIPEGFHAEIEGNRVVIKRGEQKPDTNCLLSWSETDEKMLQSLEGIVKDYWAKAEQEKNEIKIREASNVSYFLKTIQKSPLCWIKCSDELPNRDGIYLVVTDGRHNDVYDMARYDSIEGWHKASEIIYWMPIPQLNNKSIIEQKPADNIESSVQNKPWSKEDEEMFIEIILDLKALKNRDTGEAGKAAYQREIDWLESIRPQSQWKPSDEQMKVLKEACDEHWEPDGLDPLYTLYQDLKKLIE